MVHKENDDLLLELSQRLQVMRTQETSKYVVLDYLDLEAYNQAKPPMDAKEVVGEDNSPPHLTDRGHSSDDSDSGTNISSESGSVTSSTVQIDESWRKTICEWCYKVVDHFDFDRQVVSIAMSYFDRYLAKRSINRRTFQLVAITALYLAIKIFEPRKLHIDSIVELSHGQFSAEHIIAMESAMLQSLQWHLHPPTPHAFCNDFLRLVPDKGISLRTRADMTELALFLTELSVCDYWFVKRKPSSIAMASILSAIELQGPRAEYHQYQVDFLQQVVNIGVDIAKDEEVVECYDRLRNIFIAGGYNEIFEEELASVEKAAQVQPLVVGVGGAVSPDAIDLISRCS